MAELKDTPENKSLIAAPLWIVGLGVYLPLYFEKGGKLSGKDKWYYDGKELEVVKHFIYLGAVFSSGRSFLENQKHFSRTYAKICILTHEVIKQIW